MKLSPGSHGCRFIQLLSTLDMNISFVNCAANVSWLYRDWTLVRSRRLILMKGIHSFAKFVTRGEQLWKSWRGTRGLLIHSSLAQWVERCWSMGAVLESSSYLGSPAFIVHPATGNYKSTEVWCSMRGASTDTVGRIPWLSLGRVKHWGSFQGGQPSRAQARGVGGPAGFTVSGVWSEPVTEGDKPDWCVWRPAMQGTG